MAAVCRRSSGDSFGSAWARGLDQVALVGLEWVDWFNHRRLHSAVRRRSTCRYGLQHYSRTATSTASRHPRVSTEPGVVQSS
jgi:hypothetical protein